MVIAAHPDDADFGPAATAARWIDAGSVGWLVCCTSGDAGGEDPDARSARPGRRARAGAATQPPGSSATQGVTFLHQPDGALVNDLALREQLVREIRTFRPDAVLATDPDVLFYRDGGVNHTDHREAGMAAVDAVYPAARNPMAFPWLARSGLATHVVRRLYLFWPNEPTARVDVTATIDRKIDALRAHASQIHEPEKLDERMRELGEGVRRGRSASRRPRRSGSWSSRTTRTRARPARRRRARRARPRPPTRATAPGRQRRLSPPTSSSGRTLPHSFQSSARPSARRPSSETSSPSVRPPAASADVLVGGDRHVAQQVRHLGLGRPAPDPHRVEAGVADGERQVALARDAVVGPAAEAVEAVAERGERAGDVAGLGPG